MKNLRSKKQITDCLKEVGVSLWDKNTRSELTLKALDYLVDFIVKSKTEEEFISAIEVVRFSNLIDEFQIEDKSPDKKFEFYVQHKREIDKDKEKALVFQKKFKILDLLDFQLELKKKDWYLPEFYDDILRADIIADQQYKCGMCSKDVSDSSPHLHHIDYDKTNCSRENLIFVCSRCHGKTNSNRPFWNKLLTERQQEIIYGQSRKDAQ